MNKFESWHEQNGVKMQQNEKHQVLTKHKVCIPWMRARYYLVASDTGGYTTARYS